MKKKMKKYAEGGFTAAQEEFLGGADRTDPYILARMRAAHPDEPAPTSRDFDTTDSETPSMDLPAAKSPKAVTKTVVKTKVEPAPKKDESKAEKKPYIDISKDTSIGLRQFRSDGVSPIERLIKNFSGKSQRTTSAEKGMKKGGSVKTSSASKRGDGCAQRGKTKGRMV